jgi:hypothetical protein
MDENHIPTVADSDHPDSDVELDRDDLEVASIIDPTYVNDINSELQDQGIGVAGDAFSTQVQILGHSLRNVKLTLKVLLGDSMVPVDADWKDIREDVPAILASYILKNGIGQKTANPESRVMYQWAKEFMPNLRRAMVHVEKTYGIVPQRLSKLC